MTQNSDQNERQNNIFMPGESPTPNAIDGGFAFRDGTVVDLLPIPPLSLNYITANEAGKPKVPQALIERRGHRKHEANPDDPAYQEALKAWDAAKQNRLLKFIITRGVVQGAPEDVYEQYLSFLPDGSDESDVKFMWIADKLTTQAEIERFVEAVVSQTIATEEGIAESENYFPGSGERQADQIAPA